MGLKLVVDTLEGLEQSVAGLYTKGADGKFTLGVDGLEDTTGLKTALKQERDNVKAANSRATEAEKLTKQFQDLGMSAEEVTALVNRFKTDEEGQLLAKGKIDEVFGKRTEKMRTDYEGQLKAEKTATEKERQKAAKFIGRVLENSIRQAATAAGVNANAVEDALLRARSVFTVDDEGNPVAMKDGTELKGKDGVTPLSPTEWMESMKAVAPHWFPAPSSGSGARQSSGNNNGAQKTIKRTDFDHLSPVQKRESLKSGFSVVD